MANTRSSDTPLICTLNAGSGGAPVHLVPSAGVTPLSLVQLARAIDPPRQVYSFKAAGTEDEREPHATIEEMAASNVAEIRDVQPAGPYTIAGHCFGGFVALEMVAQLEKQGEQVAILALIDTFFPLMADDFDRHIGNGTAMPEIDVELGEKRLSEALQSVHRQAGSQFSMVPPEIARRFERVLKMQIDGGFNYRCRPVQCPIALIRTPLP